jgi:hypothetical protein
MKSKINQKAINFELEQIEQGMELLRAYTQKRQITFMEQNIETHKRIGRPDYTDIVLAESDIQRRLDYLKSQGAPNSQLRPVLKDYYSTLKTCHKIYDEEVR